MVLMVREAFPSLGVFLYNKKIGLLYILSHTMESDDGATV